jgi:hypothetical protein
MYSTYERNNESRSRNQYCRGQAVSMTYSGRVFVALACNAHAPYYTGICDLSASTVFFRNIS